MKSGSKPLSQSGVLFLFQQAAKNPDSPFYNCVLNVNSEPELLVGGVLNDVYKVKVNNTEYVVKWMTGNNLDPSACGSNKELYDLQKHIAGLSEIVPKPYVFVGDFQGHDAIIMEYIGGIALGKDDMSAIRLGESISRFHEYAKDLPKFKTQPSDMRAVFSELKQWAKRLWQKGQVLKELEYLYTFFKYAFDTLFYPSDSKLPGGLIHGDLHENNILVCDESISLDTIKLLDFDLVREDKYIKDIANAICMFCLPEIEGVQSSSQRYQFDATFARNIIQGYQCTRTLSQAELDYLPVAILDRIRLEKVGNMKLRNEGKPPGSNFNAGRAKAMMKFLQDEWTDFEDCLKAGAADESFQNVFTISGKGFLPGFDDAAVTTKNHASSDYAVGPSDETTYKRR
tara:strand:+ start:36727 stop:37923 length:1197 start_codon:yes stop_codon:yes gene_type:complete